MQWMNIKQMHYILEDHSVKCWKQSKHYSSEAFFFTQQLFRGLATQHLIIMSNLLYNSMTTKYWQREMQMQKLQALEILRRTTHTFSFKWSAKRSLEVFEMQKGMIWSNNNSCSGDPSCHWSKCTYSAMLMNHPLSSD